MNSASRGSSDNQGSEQYARRQEKRELTRVALLDAAERLWAERGIFGASLDDIAASAGLTKGAVYSNFTGKTDLLLALLDRYTEANLDIQTRMDRPAARQVAMLLMEFWLYAMRDYTAGWRIAEWYETRRAGLARDLTDADDMPAAEAAERATIAMALEFGMTLQHLLDPERVPAETYASGMRLVLGTRTACEDTACA
jgi:AcrR family transcriptional regulator